MSYRGTKLTLAFVICGLLLTTAIVPLFVPEQKYHALVERLISQSLERQVKISELKYQLFPLPHIEGNNITILSSNHDGEAIISQIAIWFSYTELLKGKISINHLHFNGVATNQSFIESFISQYKNSSASSPSLVHIKRISSASVSIRTHDNTLVGPFRFEGFFDNDRDFFTLNLSLIDTNLEARIIPVNKQRIQIDISGKQFNLPFYSNPTPFDYIAARAFYEHQLLEITEFNIEAYGSQLSGRLNLKHEASNEWIASGNLNVEAFQLANLLSIIKPTDNEHKISGIFSGTFNVTARGPVLSKLHKAANIQGNFHIAQARVQGPKSSIYLDALSAHTAITNKHALFSQVGAQLYGGTLQAKNIGINWHKDWRISGALASENLDYVQLVTHLFDTPTILSGKLSGTAAFSSQANTASNLVKQLQIQGNLELLSPTIKLNTNDSRKITLTDLESIHLNDFNYTPKVFSAKTLNIAGYNGQAEATGLTLSWNPQWLLNAHITTKQLSLPTLLHELGQTKYIDGNLTANFSLKSDTPSWDKFFDFVQIEGELEIDNGIAFLSPATSTIPSKQFEFRHAQANARYTQHNLIITQASIHAYGGTINTRDLHLSNDDKWTFYSEISADNIDLAPFLRDTTNQHIVSGKAGTQSTLTLDAPTFDQLTTNINASGSFYVNNGTVYNANIEQAVAINSGSPTKKATTEFSELSSKFDIINNTIELSKLRIHSPNLSGKGNIIIHENQKIEGTLDVALRSTGNLLKIPLNVSGTADDPQFTLTGGALIGSAIGTSVLGPGIGTVIGLQTGKIFTSISDLFSKKNKKTHDSTFGSSK